MTPYANMPANGTVYYFVHVGDPFDLKTSDAVSMSPSGEISISPPPPFDISLSNDRVSVLARNTGDRRVKFSLEVRGVPTGWSVEDANFSELDPGASVERSVEVQGPLTGGAFDATFVLRACASNVFICLNWTDIASTTYRFTAQPRQVTRIFTGVSSEVLIDGVFVGTTRREFRCLLSGVCLDFDAAPGVHEVWVRAVENGYNDARSMIDLTENGRITLTPIPQDLEEECSDWSADIHLPESTEVNLRLSPESLSINPRGRFTVQPAFTLQPSLRLCISMANGEVYRMRVEGELVESASLRLIANGALIWSGELDLYNAYLTPFFFGPVLIVPHARVFLRGEVGFEAETTLVARQNLTSTVRLVYDGRWRDNGSGFSCNGVAVRIQDIASQCVETEGANVLRGKAGLSIWAKSHWRFSPWAVPLFD